MIKIYHNNRCGKSRQGVDLLENSNQPFEIIKYLENPLNEIQIRDLLTILNISALALVRQNEAIWKEHYKGKNLTEEEIIKAVVKHPILMERPIVVNRTKAVIGRPPENIKTII